MAKKLLIVESPAKAKTIEKYLGKDFQVKSSFGHIRDLEKAGMGIDIENNYHPRYIVSEGKQKVVRELKSLASHSDEVWLATDEDREGEAISWHLCEVLGLDPGSTKRIVFHEITKPAIQAAVANPRTVDMHLVDAQQARRVLDRIVGFELSPVLWRKISASNNLSAGRVQSVAVRLIAEREREINAFESQNSFKIEAVFSANDLAGKLIQFKAEGKKYDAEQDAAKFLQSCVAANYTVSDIFVKPGKRSPAPPFTTSTLQQEASRKLGYSVSKTMLVAQQLYENGLITYMRTDSVNLSNTALADITNSVKSLYGENYHQFRQYKTKSRGAQEAHEAIRPTYMNNTSVENNEWKRLYELIWKRTMASQMADALLEKTSAKIEISTNKEELTATGEVVKFDGFLKVYREDQDEEDLEDTDLTAGAEGSSKLPPLQVTQKLPLVQMSATEKFTRPQPRYTEASLVKKLEELGIGRPSTYAPTISTIQKRGYVEKRDKQGIERMFRVLLLKNDQISKRHEKEVTGFEKAKMFPTDLGLLVTDFLKQHFEDIMDYGFTARIEDEFDDVAEGKMKWNDMIDSFYNPFKTDVEKTIEQAERIKGEKELGTEPGTGKPVIARMGRFGPMVQIGISDEGEEATPRFASLRKGQSIETITLEEALELFRLPLSLGEHEGKEVSVNSGRYGPYVKWGDDFVSLPRSEDPLAVDLHRAVELISQKQKADAPVGSYEGKPVTKGKGRFGPFIKWNEMYINVPKRYNFDHLEQKDLEELIQSKIEKEANRYVQQWPDEKISIENGRWGPYIRFGKKMLKINRKETGEKYTAEELSTIDLNEIKKMIELELPDAFKKSKKTVAPKKAAAKKAPVKKK